MNKRFNRLKKLLDEIDDDFGWGPSFEIQEDNVDEDILEITEQFINVYGLNESSDKVIQDLQSV
jgi:hypothetical protein